MILSSPPRHQATNSTSGTVAAVQKKKASQKPPTHVSPSVPSQPRSPPAPTLALPLANHTSSFPSHQPHPLPQLQLLAPRAHRRHHLDLIHTSRRADQSLSRQSISNLIPPSCLLYVLQAHAILASTAHVPAVTMLSFLGTWLDFSYSTFTSRDFSRYIHRPGACLALAASRRHALSRHGLRCDFSLSCTQLSRVLPLRERGDRCRLDTYCSSRLWWTSLCHVHEYSIRYLVMVRTYLSISFCSLNLSLNC